MKGWTYRNTQDKLLIFVSSRIGECSEERNIVKESITSLNHTPVIFELIGARPYPPRDMYLSRLRDSQIMVAIYKQGYGYIDASGGMEISGLEDEYIFAKTEEIKSIFYVWNDQGNEREERLQNIVDEVTSGQNTVAYYQQPNELGALVKNDLTALITEEFIRKKLEIERLSQRSLKTTLGLKQKIGSLINRASEIDELVHLNNTASIFCITGKPGSGKTTIAAQLSEKLDALFINCTGLAPKDIFLTVAYSIDIGSNLRLERFSSLEESISIFSSTWEKTESIVLILDECEYIEEILNIIDRSGGVSSTKKIIITSRNKIRDLPYFEIPKLTTKGIIPLTEETTKDFLLTIKNIIDSQDLDHSEFSRDSKHDGNNFSINKTADEIIKYIAISPIELSAEELISLKGDEKYSIADLSIDIASLNPIVADNPSGYTLANEEIVNEIVRIVKKSHQQYRFFTNRLVRLMEKTRRYRFAFLLSETLDKSLSQKYIKPAILEAAKLADWKLGLRLTQILVDKAMDNESKSEALPLLLSMVYPLELIGDTKKADEIIEQAEEISGGLNNDDLLFIKEVKLSSRARRSLNEEDVKELRKAYDSYGENKFYWHQARIGLELSAIYISGKRFQKSYEILVPTLKAFENEGDDYGVSLARRNLASTLISIPDKQKEVDKYIELVTSEIEESKGDIRQRAWICNVLATRYRKSNRLEDAKAMSTEAISIATELGDESLRAINLINLGNVLGDLKDPTKAIETYNEAAKASEKCSRLDIDAESSRLVAGIYNDFDFEDETNTSKREKAIIYSKHAISLAKSTININTLAYAYLELGDAYRALKRSKDAANAFFNSAIELNKLGDKKAITGVIETAVNASLPDHIDEYIIGLSKLFSLKLPNENLDLSNIFIALTNPIIENLPDTSLIYTLGKHLDLLCSNIPIDLRRGVILKIIEKLKELDVDQLGPIRLLYAGVAIAVTLKDVKQPFLYNMLSKSIAGSVDGLYFREEGDGSRLWTIVLNLGRTVTISLASLDNTTESDLAALALAFFTKGFEDDLKDLLGCDPATNEITINIGMYDFMPDEIKHTSDKFGLGKTLEKQNCAVTRPVNYFESIPTFVFLSSNFLQEFGFRDKEGSSLQELYAVTLLEITFQLLKGEVDIETLRPKIVSLVRASSP